MKCTIPEISWHNRDPVLSVDVQPIINEGFYRLASGGTDSHVLIWHLTILDTGACCTEPVSDLTRHQKAVNVVRWSHCGQYLASGDDDANIIIWQQKPDDLAVMLDGDNEDKEKWTVLKVLRGHKEDVYDISWSPDSSKLISGSVDNTAIIWDLNKGLNDNILTDHKGFVQGVCWDPLGQLVATLSSDRVCRVFNESGKQVKARLKKGILPLPESHCLNGQVVRYFHDDTLKSFFRRLSFSPDGSFIVTPAGCLEMGPNNKKLYTSYLFSTNNLTQPSIILPSPNQYTIAARCCPILFQLRPDGPDPVIALPYRIVFAIASRSSVILYDTQQMSPFATISNIHYTRLTDVTWSHDGRLLAVCSTDGFCSLVTFEPNELGEEYVKEVEVVEEESQEEEIMDTSINEKEEKKEKKPSFLQMWTKRAQDEIKKNDKPISRIDVRRKPREETKIEENKNESKNEKPVSVIEVRRKPRETLYSKDGNEIKQIEVRKNPRKSLENEFKNSEKDMKTTPVDIELKQTTTEMENTQENDKSKTENKTESAMEVDDDVVLIEEKENSLENSETTPIDKELKKTTIEIENTEENDKSTTKSAMEVDDDIELIEEKENLTNNTETPIQPDTTQSKDETPSKQKTNNTLTPDSKKKRGRKPKTNSTPNKPPPKKSSTGQLNITQFLKSPPPVKPTPKTKEKTDKNDKMNPYVLLENCKLKTYRKENVIEISDDSNSNFMPTESTELNFEEDTQNLKLVLEEETIDEKMETEKTTNTENLMEISTTEKTEIEKKESMNGEKTDCDKPFTNIISLPKDSPAKKRVPLITLSSPKQKKKPM